MVVLMYNLHDASKETVKELIDKNTYIFPTNPNVCTFKLYSLLILTV